MTTVKFPRALALDTSCNNSQNAPACFNQPPRFAVLRNKGRQAALKAAVVTSANPLLPFNGKQGQGGFIPAGFTLFQYCEPCPALAALMFRSIKGGLSNLIDKVNSMFCCIFPRFSASTLIASSMAEQGSVSLALAASYGQFSTRPLVSATPSRGKLAAAF